MNSKEIVVSIFATTFKVVLAIIIVMLVYKGSVTAYEYGQRVFNEPPVTSGSGRTIRVTIAEGSTAEEIGAELEKKGLIRDRRLFQLQELLSEYRNKLQPGTYELNTSMTAEEMMAIMAAGKGEGESGDYEE
ncbi:MAG: endolytic transglycosylase MltG [Lachnospiraceae bacterium]